MKNTLPLITIGLDLGDKKHAVCVIDRKGEVVREDTITNHKESLRRLSKKYPKSRIALEVGSHSPWTSRMLEGLGHEVLVANPRKLRAIYANNRKSDRTDARMLARLARMRQATACGHSGWCSLRLRLAQLLHGSEIPSVSVRSRGPSRP